jgi:Ca2+-binding RTX toxin-like protein
MAVINLTPNDDTRNDSTDSNTINALAGDDVVAGKGGNDIINGGPGDDTLSGDSGRDTLNGGEDADTLSGGSGVDRLVGGADDDRLTGGGANDIFVFDTEEVGDVIADFQRGDKIDLQAIDANTLVALDQAFVSVTASDVLGGVQTLNFFSEDQNTIVQGNTDADTDVEFQVVLENFSGNLTLADFIA